MQAKDPDKNYEEDNGKKDLDDAMQTLNQIMKSKIDQLKTSIKKAVVQLIIWAVAAAAVYYIWSDKWYFWIPTSVSFIMAATVIFGVVCLRKISTKMNESRS